MGMAMALCAPLRYASVRGVRHISNAEDAIFPLLIALFGIGGGQQDALVHHGCVHMTAINTLTAAVRVIRQLPHLIRRM